MKKLSKAILLVTFLVIGCPSVWSQASPSTEGRDFWVTFLRAQQDPTELILTISAREACTVTVENPKNNFSTSFTVTDNSSTTISTNRAPSGAKKLQKTDCYSTTNESAKYTALHVTSTKDISLFAGNYISKTFDAANILPTTALLDDYLVQTYPPSDHGGVNESRGSHFAIVAVEDGTTEVEYTLTAKTANGKTGLQTASLAKGQVWYVGTGDATVGDAGDLSGTIVKAKYGKKIAVFQGCPHTNVPYMVRDRDHLFSQAMPTAYWGTEFGITSSLQHRRDIVAVMAINNGTQVYINNEDGEKVLVHTFDFTQDKKHYWTFEIGEEIAYCNDADQKKKLDAPLVSDSSCFITTSCPAGVHLFMVSNKYDNVDPNGKNNCDPAMLWISPIEQVIKEINFSTYNKGTNNHYMNIVTTTSNVAKMTLDDKNIKQYFHTLSGKDDYSFARLEIDSGNHNLKGDGGFLAHVYGYGVNESYAYSCGSSTIQRGLALNGTSLDVGGVASNTYCVDKEINMKLNIGNNDYQKIVWDYGDGISYSADITASNEEKTTTSHTYTVPGWYDLIVSAEFINECTNAKHKDDMHFSFYVDRPDTLYRQVTLCADSVPNYHFDEIPNTHTYAMKDPTVDEIIVDTITSTGDCSNAYILTINAVAQRVTLIDLDTVYSIEQRRDSALIPGDGYDKGDGTYHPAGYVPTTREYDSNVRYYHRRGTQCDSIVKYRVSVIKCLEFQVNNPKPVCYMGDFNADFVHNYDGTCGALELWIDGKKNCEATLAPDTSVSGPNGYVSGLITAHPKNILPGEHTAFLKVKDVNCDRTIETPKFSLPFYYPDSIIALKFDNVLVLYKKGYGGNINPGWDFLESEVLWFHGDDPEPIATGPVYHTCEPLPHGDTYHVVLKRSKDEQGIRSCDFMIPLYDYNGYERPSTAKPCDGSVVPTDPSKGNDSGNAPAADQPTKFVENNKLYILYEGTVYNMFGQKVK